jgi:hypothetical protein
VKLLADLAHVLQLKDERARCFRFTPMNPACVLDACDKIVEQLLLHLNSLSQAIRQWRTGQRHALLAGFLPHLLGV